MDLYTSKVVGLWVAHKNMVCTQNIVFSQVLISCITALQKHNLFTNFKVNSSSDMEAYAAKTLLLNFAWVHGLAIHSLTTDRSLSMKAMLE